MSKKKPIKKPVKTPYASFAPSAPKPVKTVTDRYGLVDAVYAGESSDLIRVESAEDGSGYIHMLSAETGRVIETLVVEARLKR